MGKRLLDKVNYIGAELTLKLPNIATGTLQYGFYITSLIGINKLYERDVPSLLGWGLIPIAAYATLDSGLRIFTNQSLLQFSYYNEKKQEIQNPSS